MDVRRQKCQLWEERVFGFQKDAVPFSCPYLCVSSTVSCLWVFVSCLQISDNACLLWELNGIFLQVENRTTAMLMAAAQFVYFIHREDGCGEEESWTSDWYPWDAKVGSEEARLTAKRNLERPGQMGVNRRLPTVTSSPFQIATLREDSTWCLDLEPLFLRLYLDIAHISQSNHVNNYTKSKWTALSKSTRCLAFSSFLTGVPIYPEDWFILFTLFLMDIKGSASHVHSSWVISLQEATLLCPGELF